MKEMQQKVGEFTAKYNLNSSPEIRYIDFISEAGELGKEILKSSGYGSAEARRTDSLETEMGDALFSLLCLANGLDISLEQALDRVLAKYEARFSEKGDIGSGR